MVWNMQLEQILRFKSNFTIHGTTYFLSLPILELERGNE